MDGKGVGGVRGKGLTVKGCRVGSYRGPKEAFQWRRGSGLLSQNRVICKPQSRNGEANDEVWLLIYNFM